MSVATYGEHAEAAAWALNRLVVTDDLPVEPADVDQLLHCREALVDGLHQRLYAFGLNARAPGSDAPLPASTLRLLGISHRLPNLLDVTAFEVASLQLEERQPPTEVLAQRSRNNTVELWRQAAIEVLAGSHALDVAPEQPWLHDYGAGWYVMRDLAVALEAFLVLDARLEEVGLLSQHVRAEASLGLEERRLVASQLARVANWYATSDAPDQAAPAKLGGGRVVGPVQLVSCPADLAVAQRRLAGYLRPLNGNDVFHSGEPEIAAESAKQLVASQLYLSQVFSQIAELRGPAGRELRLEFVRRAELLEETQPQLRHLVDVNAPDPSKQRAWQQGELTASVRRMQRDGVALVLTPAQVLELANATHEVTHNLALSLRRELLRGNSNLRMADPTGQVGATRVPRSSRLEVSLTNLINQPPPSLAVSRFTSPVQRAALRMTLDATPPRSESPSPYPAARGLGASDHRR